ncbi:family 2 encapsulin nanocompartment cargo protein polyprenyl transferase [Lentzea roselyniae]|uniref:Family 2 encapsulin nanocompartment cargo protein polyprenyl transferase n=1 Tax=Lentzea roselyniae TaxID=531940 RepID=A0ABP7CJS4_9PSEU
MTTNSTVVTATEVLRRSADQIDGPLRAAIAQLPEPLRIGAGFHFGWWDAGGNHITGATGKMVRPAFALSAARAVSGQVSDTAVRVGVAVELAHNFSLVHDDVLDGDRTRRGRPTVWAQFGVPHAILIGDALLALASQVLTHHDDSIELCAELNSTVIALCAGQHQDMLLEKQLHVSPADYLEMAGGKTAALVASACALGAMASGASPAQTAALRQFGHHVGLAFQLVDDVLGLFGDPALTGKPAGADLLRYKKSMPVVAAMQSGTAAGDELTELYRAQAITVDLVPHAVDLVARAGGKEWTEMEAERCYELALDSLDAVDGRIGTDEALRVLAKLMINRNR